MWRHSYVTVLKVTLFHLKKKTTDKTKGTNSRENTVLIAFQSINASNIGKDNISTTLVKLVFVLFLIEIRLLCNIWLYSIILICRHHKYRYSLLVRYVVTFSISVVTDETGFWFIKSQRWKRLWNFFTIDKI